MRSIWTVILMVMAFCIQARTVQASPPPTMAVASLQQAWQSYRSGNCRNAQKILDETLRIAPEWQALYFDRGVVAEHCGEAQLAATHYRRYASFDPGQRVWVSERATLLDQYLHSAATHKDTAPERRGFPWWGWALIGGGALVVVAVIVAASGALSSTPEDTCAYCGVDEGV